MPSAALIGALRVTLGLDSAAFESGMSKAARTSAQTQSQIEGHLGRIRSSMDGLKSAATGFAAGIASLGLIELGKRALDYASSLAEVAQQMGVTTKTLQEYRYIATQVGISQEEMDGGLQKLTRSIGMAGDGSKKQTAAFADLGISVRDANGNLKSTDEVLPLVISSLSNIKEPAARAAIEMALFGKSGQQLDTLLAGGIDQVNNLREAAKSLGIVLSEDQIANADRTADKLAELKTVLSANIAGAVANNASAIYDMVNALERLVAKLPDAIRWIGNFQDRFAQAQSYVAAGIDLAAGQSDLARLNFGEAAAAQGRIDGRRRTDFGNAGANAGSSIGSSLFGGGSRARLTGGVASGGGGGGRTRRAGGGSRSGRSPEDTLQQTLDALLPDDAERTRLAAQAKELRAALARGGLDQATFERAMGAVSDRGDRISRLTTPFANDNLPDLATPKLRTQVDGLTGLLDHVKVANGELRESFADTARTALDSFQRIADGLRGGGLLNVLGSLLDAFQQIGSTGLFGKSIQTNLRGGLAGARAMGGPVNAGGTYLVGERGPELFTPAGGGKITPNGGFGGGVSFDLRGAVMTADLLQQMSAIAASTGGRMVVGNNAAMMKSRRQALA